MSQFFYTNVYQNKGTILVRGYKNGERYVHRDQYSPYLFCNFAGDMDQNYSTIDKKTVSKVCFDDIGKCRKFRDTYANVKDAKIYGMTQWIYPYIYDNFYSKREMEFDISAIRLGIIDIETEITNAEGNSKFPNIRAANKEITSICLRFRKTNYVFSCVPYVPGPDTIYVPCVNEKQLLNKFIDLLGRLDLDVITAWNLTFDVPYITNRCERILGVERTKKLSPWGIINKREVFVKGNEVQHVDWVGIATIDYIDTFKKFSNMPQEMYTLEYVSQQILGEHKVDYSEYKDLDDLRSRNPQMFIDYNIHDCVLVDRIDTKLNLFDIQFSIAYLAGCNFEDTHGTVKPWDALIHKYLMDRNIVVPQTEFGEDDDSIEGAFVLEPIVGKYYWIISEDYSSLYPSIAQQANISPETILTTIPNIDVTYLFDRKLEGTKLQKTIRENKASLCATGCLFDNEFEGFIPALMRSIYEERVKIRKTLKKVNQALQKAKEEGLTDLDELQSKSASMNAKQHALKILLNSGYGALACKYFRWFDPRLAESITKTGQLTIKWTQRAINKYLNEICDTKGVEYVIYGDTDSVYLQLNDWVIKNGLHDKDITTIIDAIDDFCATKLEKVINDLNQELMTYLNHRRLVLTAKREKIAGSGFWTAKKKYALKVWDDEGVRFAEPKIKVTGLESIKQSVPRVVRPLINDVISILLNKDQKDLFEFFEASRSIYWSKAFEDIAQTKTVNGLTTYGDPDKIFKKRCPINTRAALTYNHMIKKLKLTDKYPLINEEDKIKFCYLTMPNPVQSNIIGTPDTLPIEFGLEEYIDYNTQFEKTFVRPIQMMADAIGWKLVEKPDLSDLYVY